MYYIIYKTTNLINNKFYYGKHSTNDLNDGYMGSGKLLKNSIKKYGKENFIKEILCFCDSEQDAYELEELVITEIEVNNPQCYNIVCGGHGFSFGVNNPNYNKPLTIEAKLHLSECNKGINNPMYNKVSPFKNKKHSEVTKNKISKSKIGKSRKNSKTRKTQKQRESYVSVIQYDLLTNIELKIYSSLKLLPLDGFDPSNVVRCCKNKQKSHKGFGWKYIGV